MSGASHIAVVIATYNRKDLVVETVRSVLTQELPAGWEFSVIVVDDGSTDGTAAHLQTIFKDEPRVVVLPVTNRERGAARNHGAFTAIERFHSKWLLFLDSDDLLVAGSLRAFLDRLQRSGAQKSTAAVYANLVLWYGNDNFGAKKFSAPAPEGDLQKALLTKPLLSIGITLISSEMFSALGGFSDNRMMSGSEDWEFWCRLAGEGTILYSDHLSIWYRQHAENTGANNLAVSIATAMDKIENNLGHRSTAMRFQGTRWIAGAFNAECKTAKALGYWAKSLAIQPLALFAPSTWIMLVSILVRSCK